jgi:pyridoxine kinase
VKFICVHSLTCAGDVGLRPYLEVLGEACRPLPSIVLTGPGNLPGVCRHALPIGELLPAALDALAASGKQVGMVIGYLADAGQVASLSAFLADRRQHLSALVVDPICGDEGRAYVSEPLIRAWPDLFASADWVFPNQTEIELLTGERGELAIAAFRRRWPNPGLIVTGAIRNQAVETRLELAGASFRHQQPRIAGHHSGTGDRFAAVWLREHYLRGHTARASMETACHQVAAGLLPRPSNKAGNSRDLHPS